MHRFASRIVCSTASAAGMGLLVISPAFAGPLEYPSGVIVPVHLRAEALDENRISFSAMASDPEIMFNIFGGLAHQFRADIDGGGSFSSTRIGATVGAMSQITPDFDVRFTFGYEFDHYSFSGDTGIGGFDPWGDIHTFGFGVIFGAHLTNEWKIFGGPVFQFSAESGASFSDGFIGGGIIGTSFDLSPDLTLGGGIGVVSQIERGTRFFPVLLVNWQITDRFRLTTETHTGASGDIGAELIYDWGGGFETAVGGSYRFRRFRLDDGGPAPEGVGQHSSLPFWLRLGYRFNPHFSVSAYGGVVLAGELRLLDSNGNRIGKEDYDPAGLIGVSASIRF